MKAEEITDLCTGCFACAAVCPKRAINAKEDVGGFSIPTIDQSLCIDCKLCQKVCPQNKLFPTDSFEKVAFGMIANDKDILKGSASGGVFATIAYEVINRGGIVVGCAFDNTLVARHIIVDRPEDLSSLFSSKYVQSDTFGLYKKVKDLLDEGRFVLFSGTGCQASALKSFLKKDYNNLIIADIICHGVPSPLLFKKYLEYLSTKYKGEIRDVNFRDKLKNGWGLTLRFTFMKKDNTLSNLFVFGRCDKYYKAYLDGKIHRYACYECKYNLNNRASDFTMGDFWNILKVNPKFYNQSGVSEIIVNTEKGLTFLQEIFSKFDVHKTSLDICVAGNSNLVRPQKIPAVRRELDDIMHLPAERLFEQRYFEMPKFKLLLNKLIFMVPVKIKTNAKLLIYKLKR